MCDIDEPLSCRLEMKYPETAAIGHAGEFFFAYQVARVLGWPCRLFDVDIGVDAQVEILGDDYESTGRFVAFQIKCTSMEEVDSRYVGSEQLAYWKNLDIPVFLALVDLGEEAIYLHRVDPQTEYHKTDGGQYRIDFDRQRCRFGPASREVFSSAAEEAQIQAVEAQLKKVREATRGIEEQLARHEASSDPWGLIEVMRDRILARAHLLRAHTLAYNSHAGISEYERDKLAFDQALDKLRDVMSSRGFEADWDGLREGEGEIGRFLAEG
jgi:hypothetical protein